MTGVLRKETPWGFFTDSVTEADASRVAITDGSRQLIEIDGLGSNAEPNTLDDVWDVAESCIKPGALGITFVMRVNFKVYTGASGGVLHLEADIGNGVPNVIMSDKRTLEPNENGTGLMFALPVFVGETFETNGLKLYLKPVGCDVEASDLSLFVRE